MNYYNKIESNYNFIKSYALKNELNYLSIFNFPINFNINVKHQLVVNNFSSFQSIEGKLAFFL